MEPQQQQQPQQPSQQSQAGKRVNRFKRRVFPFTSEKCPNDRNLMAVNEEFLIMRAQNHTLLEGSSLYSDIGFQIPIGVSFAADSTNETQTKPDFFCVHDMKFLTDEEQRAIHAEQFESQPYTRKNVLAIIDNFARVFVFVISIDYEQRIIETLPFSSTPSTEQDPCEEIIWIREHLCVRNSSNLFIDFRLQLQDQRVISKTQFMLNDQIGLRTAIAVVDPLFAGKLQFFGISSDGTTVHKQQQLLSSDSIIQNAASTGIVRSEQLPVAQNDLLAIFSKKNNDLIIVVSRSGKLFAISMETLQVLDTLNLGLKQSSEAIIEAHMDNTAMCLFVLTAKSKIIQITLSKLEHKSTGAIRVFTATCAHRFKIDGQIFTFRVLAIPSKLQPSVFAKPDPNSLSSLGRNLEEDFTLLSNFNNAAELATTESMNRFIESTRFLIFTLIPKEDAQMKIFSIDLSLNVPLLDLNEYMPAAVVTNDPTPVVEIKEPTNDNQIDRWVDNILVSGAKEALEEVLLMKDSLLINPDDRNIDESNQNLLVAAAKATFESLELEAVQNDTRGINNTASIAVAVAASTSPAGDEATKNNDTAAVQTTKKIPKKQPNQKNSQTNNNKQPLEGNETKESAVGTQLESVPPVIGSKQNEESGSQLQQPKIVKAVSKPVGVKKSKLPPQQDPMCGLEFGNETPVQPSEQPINMQSPQKQSQEKPQPSQSSPQQKQLSQSQKQQQKQEKKQQKLQQQFEEQLQQQQLQHQQQQQLQPNQIQNQQQPQPQQQNQRQQQQQPQQQKQQQQQQQQQQIYQKVNKQQQPQQQQGQQVVQQQAQQQQNQQQPQQQGQGKKKGKQEKATQNIQYKPVSQVQIDQKNEQSPAARKQEQFEYQKKIKQTDGDAHKKNSEIKPINNKNNNTIQEMGTNMNMNHERAQMMDDFVESSPLDEYSTQDTRVKYLFSENLGRLTGSLDKYFEKRFIKLDTQINVKIDKARKNESVNNKQNGGTSSSSGVDVQALELQHQASESQQQGSLYSQPEQLAEYLKNEMKSQYEGLVASKLKEHSMQMLQNAESTLQKGQRFFMEKMYMEKEKCRIQNDNMDEILSIVKKLRVPFQESSVTHQKILIELAAQSQDRKSKMESIDRSLASVIQKQDAFFKRIESLGHMSMAQSPNNSSRSSSHSSKPGNDDRRRDGGNQSLNTSGMSNTSNPNIYYPVNVGPPGANRLNNSNNGYPNNPAAAQPSSKKKKQQAAV